MPDGLTMRVKGLDEAIRDLDRLPPRIRQRAVLKGLRRGAAELKRELKRAAPVRTEGGPKRLGGGKGRTLRTRGPGFLRRKGIITRKQRGRPAYQVGPFGAAFYARFLEEGTRRQSPRPFIARTWRHVRRAVLARVTREMAKAVREEVRRVG